MQQADAIVGQQLRNKQPEGEITDFRKCGLKLLHMTVFLFMLVGVIQEMIVG